MAGEAGFEATSGGRASASQVTRLAPKCPPVVQAIEGGFAGWWLGTVPVLACVPSAGRRMPALGHAGGPWLGQRRAADAAGCLLGGCQCACLHTCLPVRACVARFARACLRAPVRARARACVRACPRAPVRALARVRARTPTPPRARVLNLYPDPHRAREKISKYDMTVTSDKPKTLDMA